jgi:hypothetical protein
MYAATTSGVVRCSPIQRPTRERGDPRPWTVRGPTTGAASGCQYARVEPIEADGSVLDSGDVDLLIAPVQVDPELVSEVDKAREQHG